MHGNNTTRILPSIQQVGKLSRFIPFRIDPSIDTLWSPKIRRGKTSPRVWWTGGCPTRTTWAGIIYWININTQRTHIGFPESGQRSYCALISFSLRLFLILRDSRCFSSSRVFSSEARSISPCSINLISGRNRLSVGHNLVLGSISFNVMANEVKW